MSSEMPSAPEGFVDAAPERTDGEEPEIELASGEEILGVVLETVEGENQYGPWVLFRIKDENRDEVIRYFARDEAKRAYFNENIEDGDTVWIARATEEVEMSNGDEYLPTHCKVSGGS